MLSFPWLTSLPEDSLPEGSSDSESATGSQPSGILGNDPARLVAVGVIAVYVGVELLHGVLGIGAQPKGLAPLVLLAAGYLFRARKQD